MSDLSNEEAKQQVTLMRARAKQNLNALFKIPEGYSSISVDRFVDDIINCAILETALIQSQALDTLPNTGDEQRLRPKEDNA